MATHYLICEGGVDDPVEEIEPVVYTSLDVASAIASAASIRASAPYRVLKITEIAVFHKESI